MGECRARPCDRALVAALARQSGLKVIGRLAEGRNAVVALRARLRKPAVIDGGRGGIADRAPMAAVARQIGN